MGKPRMTRADRWKKRPVVDRYYAFKDAIRQAAEEQDFELSDTHTIMIVIPMPKSWSKKKKKETIGKPHQQRPDADNICKGVWDSLKEEDSTIWFVKIVKYWGEEGQIGIRNHEFSLPV